jgi:hypothetical protein
VGTECTRGTSEMFIGLMLTSQRPLVVRKGEREEEEEIRREKGRKREKEGEEEVWD